MLSLRSLHRRHGANEAVVPFPTRQLFVLGMLTPRPPSSGTSFSDHKRLCKANEDALYSNVSNLRANCLYVDFPLHLLHDPIFRHHLR